MKIKGEKQRKFNYGKPFGTRVVVEADAAMDVTPGGIIVPETAKERPQFGTVLAVGPLVTEDVKPGDRVVYGKHAGVPLIIQEKTYYVMQERELFMKLDQKELDKSVAALMNKEVEQNERESFTLLAGKSSFQVGEKLSLSYSASHACRADLLLILPKGISDQRHRGHQGINCIVIDITEEMVPELKIDATLSLYESEKSTNIIATRKGKLTIEVFKINP